MPAIDGTSLLRSFWLPWRMTPPATRNSSGSRKLKKAALGLRQNRRRSSRYWRQASDSGAGARSLDHRPPPSGASAVSSRYTSSSVGRVTLSPSSRVPARERGAGQLVQQRRRIVGLALDQAAVAVAVADPVRRGAAVGAELLRLALDDDPPVLDDRHPVGQRLRLVEVVRREQDRLAERLERADRVPGVAARGRVEARGRLVEEDQLRVADQRQRQIQPPQLPARQRPRPTRPPCRPARSARSPPRRRGGGDTSRQSAQAPRGRGCGGTGPCSAARSRPASAAPADARPGSNPSTVTSPPLRCGSPRGSPPSSSCPPRWARAGRTPRRGGPRTRCPAPPRSRRRTSGGRGPRLPRLSLLG